MGCGVTVKRLKLQNIFVVISSYIFYGWWDWRFLILIAFTTLCSYASGILIERQERRLIQRWICAANITLNLLVLCIFKYFNFFSENFVSLFETFGIKLDWVTLDILLPVGISFYTFQALSYTIDIYQHKMKPTYDMVAFFAFISFFPQLVAGPIERATNLLPQFLKVRTFDYGQAVDGMQQILYGLFKKMVIADNCSRLVDIVFSNYQQLGSIQLFLGAVFFTFQIYCDFSGYSDIAIGTAKLLGIKLMKNFDYPYISRNIAEFWRRWHISLGTWMKDYIFYPFSLSKQMNRFGKWSKKHLGNTVGKAMPICLADLLIFFVVGIWHGAAWKYIAYGMYNGIIIAVSSLLEPLYAKGFEKTKIHKESKAWTEVQIIRTFILVNIGWYFDMAVSFSAALVMMKETFTKMSMSQFTGTAFLELGMGRRDFLIVLAGCIIIFIVSLLKERGVAVREAIAAKPLIVRWAIWYAFIVIIFIFAYTGDGSAFIYANF